MNTILNNFNECKDKSEFLTIWETIGFLEGLTSEQKEKAAEVYTNLANYIMENNLDGSDFATVGFPIARRIVVECPNFNVEDFDMETIYTVYSDVYPCLMNAFETLKGKYQIDTMAEATAVTTEFIKAKLQADKNNKDND